MKRLLSATTISKIYYCTNGREPLQLYTPKQFKSHSNKSVDSFPITVIILYVFRYFANALRV